MLICRTLGVFRACLLVNNQEKCSHGVTRFSGLREMSMQCVASKSATFRQHQQSKEWGSNIPQNVPINSMSSQVLSVFFSCISIIIKSSAHVLSNSLCLPRPAILWHVHSCSHRCTIAMHHMRETKPTPLLDLGPIFVKQRWRLNFIVSYDSAKEPGDSNDMRGLLILLEAYLSA